MLTQAFFASERFGDGELPKDNSSSVGVSISSRMMGSFPLLGATICAVRPLSYTSFPRSRLFQSRPVTSQSHAASVQVVPTTSSSILLVPLAFSPILDANGGTDLLAIGSLDCLPLRLPQTNQIWKGDRQSPK